MTMTLANGPKFVLKTIKSRETVLNRCIYRKLTNQLSRIKSNGTRREQFIFIFRFDSRHNHLIRWQVGVADAVLLDPLTEEAFVGNLLARFKRDQIYVSVKSVTSS